MSEELRKILTAFENEPSSWEVLLVLMRLSGEDGLVKVSKPEICRLTGLTEYHVRRGLNNLIESGYIRYKSDSHPIKNRYKSDSKGKSTVYELGSYKEKSNNEIRFTSDKNPIDIRLKSDSEDDSKRFIDIWNNVCGGKLQKVISFSAKRKSLAKAFREKCGANYLIDFEAMCKLVINDEWCCGKNDRGWKASIDYMFEPSKFDKLYDSSRKYLNVQSQPSDEDGWTEQMKRSYPKCWSVQKPLKKAKYEWLAKLLGSASRVDEWLGRVEAQGVNGITDMGIYIYEHR